MPLCLPDSVYLKALSMMTYPADLHMHTYYSDGRPAPAELVQAAQERGLRVIAITDHDTTRGSVEARPVAAARGMTLIPAVEMTTRWAGVDDETDVLGYFIDTAHSGLQTVLAGNLERLHDRVEHLCRNLSARGYAMTLADVEAQNPRYVGYVSVIDALRAKGYAADFQTAHHLFMTGWDGVEPVGVPIHEGLAAIRAAGGVPTLAHPALIRRGQYPTADELRPLVEAGLGAMEVFHPRVDEAARAYFSGLAQSFGLALTGGSDEHGWPTGFSNLGGQPITDVLVAQLQVASR